MVLPMQLRIWWADSRGKVIATLLVLWIAALISNFQWMFFLVPFFTVTSSIVLDLVVTYLRKRQFIFTLSSVVTGLLIGFIFDPTAGVLPLFVACLIAVLSKQFVAWGDHRHIYNPAAFGIVVSSVVFDRPVSWWVASWGIVPILIISVGMFIVLRRLNRLLLPGVFLLVYFLNGLLFGSIESALRLTLDGTVFLFAWVMVPEPITSLSGQTWKYWWGVLVGTFLILGGIFHVSLVDPLLTSLLLANLTVFVLVRKPWIRR